MTAEENNLILRLLRDIRGQTETDAKVEAFPRSYGLPKVAKSFGVKGRMRKVEEGMEAIAGVLTGADLLK